MLRTLVVNADDLGLTVGVNNGIFDAHDRGILTSASLMSSAPAAANAIRRARNRPTLGIGVHLTLVDGAPHQQPEAQKSGAPARGISEYARSVFDHALREAVKRGDGVVGVDHILLASLEDPKGGASSTLTELGVEPDDVRAALAA